jgi:hypothetical protein
MSENNIKIKSVKNRKEVMDKNLTNLENEINSLLLKKEEIKTKLVEEYDNYKDGVFGNDEGKTKKGELSILSDIKDSQGKVHNYYHKVFDEDEGIKNKIEEFKLSAESIKDSLVKIEEESKKLSESTNSYNSESESTLEDIKELLESAKTLISEIEEFKETTNQFCDKIDEREEKIKIQNEKISTSQSELDRLNEESSKLLQEITDKSLHNAFKIQAEEKKKAHKWYFGFSLGVLLFGVLLMMLIQFFQDGLKLDDYELWFARLFISVPVGLAYWLCTVKSNITMQLAEEYQHKASVSEALSGYRKLWDLEHDSKEYKDFFNPTVLHLINNPSDKIKFSSKDIIDKIGNIVGNKMDLSNKEE